MSTKVQIHPGAQLAGTLQIPGDKSISHRLAILAALASGSSRLHGFLRSADCLHTVKALEALGAVVVWQDETLLIEGCAGRWRQPSQALDVGNSGTSMRLLAGLLAAQPLVIEITGDASLRARPMRRIQEPLARMGAQIELLGGAGCAPLRISGRRLHAIDYVMPVASAQVKSALLLAALFAEGSTSIQEPLPTRDHTERLFQLLGLPLQVEGGRLMLSGFGQQGPILQGREWQVPGDFSSAAFWLVAAAIPGARLKLQQVGLNPRRTALLEVLRRMGATLSTRVSSRPFSAEPEGEVLIRGGRLRGIRVGGAEIPGLIDELPVLAVLGALAEGTTEIRDARELRVKESDRIAALSANLQALGVQVSEYEDGMAIRGGSAIRGGVTLHSYDDHRIVMALAMLALCAERPVLIQPVSCVAASYPDFWKHLEALGGHVSFDRCH